MHRYNATEATHALSGMIAKLGNEHPCSPAGTQALEALQKPDTAQATLDAFSAADQAIHAAYHGQIGALRAPNIDVLRAAIAAKIAKASLDAGRVPTQPGWCAGCSPDNCTGCPPGAETPVAATDEISPANWEDRLARACIQCDVSDAVYESLCIAMKGGA